MVTTPRLHPFRFFHRPLHADTGMGNARILPLENGYFTPGLHDSRVRSQSGSNSQCSYAIGRSVRTCYLTEEEKRVWLGENRFRLYIDDFGLYFVSDTIRRDYRRTRRNYYGGITCRRIRTLFQSSVDFPEYNAQ